MQSKTFLFTLLVALLLVVSIEAADTQKLERRAPRGNRRNRGGKKGGLLDNLRNTLEDAI